MEEMDKKPKRSIWEWLNQVGSFLFGVILVIGWLGSGEGFFWGIVGLVMVGLGVFQFVTWKPVPHTEEGSAQLLICPQCGEHAQAGSKFCQKCGAQLPDAPTTVNFQIKKKSHKKLLTVAVIVVFLVALVGLVNTHTPVNDAKSITLTYSTHTLDQCVRSFSSDAKWSAKKVDSDVYDVTVSGTVTTRDSDYQGEYYYIVFRLNYYNDVVSLQVSDGSLGYLSGADSMSMLLMDADSALN